MNSQKPLILLGIFIVASAVSVTIAASFDATHTRPISDFVSQQGTYCVPDGSGGCSVFVPPIPNFLGWGDGKNNLRASVDYAGLATPYLAEHGVDLGTTTEGNIIERPLADGRVEVTVLLHTSNALAWVVTDDGTYATATLLFGHRAPELVEGAEAGLTDCFLQLIFINPGPDQPLPDLQQLFRAPLPGQEWPSVISFRAIGHGPLQAAFGVADGTPGILHISETGLLNVAEIASENSVVAQEGGWPVGSINLHPAGKQ